MMPLPTQLPSFPRWCRAMVVAFALAPCLGWGSLTWETQLIQLTAKPGDKEAIASFSFKNTGSVVVTITQVQPNCGCTTADLAKPTYAPGESGEIKATFVFGDRLGLHEKLIQVNTDDPTAPPVSLALRVTIPELITCTPRLLHWNKGAEPTEQSTVIAIADPHRIAAIELTEPKPEAFALRIEAVEPGKRYRFIIRPHTLAGMTNAPIRCQVRLEDGSIHALFVYALIK